MAEDFVFFESSLNALTNEEISLKPKKCLNDSEVFVRPMTIEEKIKYRVAEKLEGAN